MKKQLILNMSLYLFTLLMTPMAFSQGKIYIDVGQAKIKKSLLALPPLQAYTSGTESLKLGQTLFSTLNNDMVVSNFFTLIKPDAFLEDTRKVGLRPAPGTPGGFNFSNWSSIGTEFLIRAGYRIINNNIELETYLYYVPQSKLVFGKSYKADKASVRKLAHKFADDVLEALTGKKGMFTSKIVVAVKKPGSKIKEIYIMDWDGENSNQVTNFKGITITPSWNNDGTKVAFTNFAYHKKTKKRNADLFLYELKTAKTWLLSHRQGVNSGASFHPKLNQMLFTVSNSHSSDIFRMDLKTERAKALIRGRRNTINVEPAYSPDGSKIAFSSTRSGQPMIYTANANGTNIKRVTFAGRYNSTPSWSPDGKKIAFAGHIKSHFDIYTIDIASNKITPLTAAYKKNGKRANNESPSYSPDGRFILFTSDRTGKTQLYIISPDGTNERQITNDNNHYSEARWSPFLD